MKNKVIISGFIGLCAIVASACDNSKANASEAAETMQDEDIALAESIDPANQKEPFKIVDNTIFNENVPVVVDVYADWCGPCKTYAPTFHAVAEKYADSACFVSLNADEYPKLCENYKINSIPATLFIMPGGGLLGKEVGVLPQERLEELVNQLIATSDGADMQL